MKKLLCVMSCEKAETRLVGNGCEYFKNLKFKYKNANLNLNFEFKITKFQILKIDEFQILKITEF
jgi:hypothetical protein